MGPRQRTPSEISIILQMIQKLNSITIFELLFYYLFKIIPSLKTSYAVHAIFLANSSPIFFSWNQHAKKVMSDSLGLVDFAIGLVNSVLNLPDGQVKFFEEFKLQRNCEINSAHQSVFGLVEMTFGLVYASFSLPEWQALKMTLFAPWKCSANVKCSSSFENKALENEDRSTKHPNLENEAPKTRKRSTQTSKTKHLNLETTVR